MKSPSPFKLAAAALATALFMLFGTGCNQQQTGPVGGPLDWPQIPRGWHAQFENKAGRNTYTIKPRRGADPLLLRKWPTNLSDDQLGAQMTKIAQQLVIQSKTASKITLVSESYQVEPASGDHWQGSQVAFQFKGNITGNLIDARLFILNLNGETWEGHFNTEHNEWPEAEQLLKRITKKE